MLKSIAISNFTVFHEAKLNFSKGLNVIIGENASGKSHLLKLGYALTKTIRQALLRDNPKDINEASIANNLIQIFLPDSLGRLATRIQGQNRCDINILYHNKTEMSFFFSPRVAKKVTINEFRQISKPELAMFIPPKEVISFYPGFAKAIDDRELEFDYTYYDLCRSLERKPLKGPRLDKVRQPLEIIDKILGGDIFQEGERFYLKSKRGLLEVQLLAEGHRKFGQIAYLLRNGSLVKQGTLFWDEPEANLNPKLIKKIAEVLVLLASFGIQVIVATHSLFLMREIDIITKSQKIKTTYTSLTLSEEESVKTQQTNNIEDIDNIVALNEEIIQSEKFLELNQGD